MEVGAGNGLTFPHYPSEVTGVTAVEPEPYLALRAARAVPQGRIGIQCIRGVAEALPLRTASCDAGVASLVLCSVDNLRSALCELHRVIRPGGELRFYEHVLSSDPCLAGWQRRMDFLWSRVNGGCHIVRETLTAITEAGFAVSECDHFTFRPNVLSQLAAPHLIGRAGR